MLILKLSPSFPLSLSASLFITAFISIWWVMNSLLYLSFPLTKGMGAVLFNSGSQVLYQHLAHSRCFAKRVTKFFLQIETHWGIKKAVLLGQNNRLDICQRQKWKGPKSSSKWSGSHFILFFFISWRLITLQYCSGFCHTLKWFSHGFTCVPHPDPPSHLPLHPIPLGLPSAPGPSTCLMHPTWAGDLFHPR